MPQTVIKKNGILGGMGYLKEQDLLNILKEKNKVLVYGAGMVGGLVLIRLKALGIDEEKIDFVVSKASNDQTYFGHKVYEIGNYEFREETTIIVATMPKNQGPIIENLDRLGFKDYIRIDDELYEEMENKYIDDFMKAEISKHNRGDIDILFMSSDNNYTSGAFLCMVDLCKGVSKEGFKPLVVLPGYGNGEKLLQDNRIDYIFIQSRSGLAEVDSDEKNKEPVLNKNALHEIEKLISRHNVKLVHNNTNHTYIGCVAAHNMGIPYVWHVRENIKEQGFDFFYDKYMYDIINNSDRIITVSKYVGSCYPKLDKKKVVNIYDGIEVDRYYYIRDILQKDKISILMPGIMVPLKGQHQLVQAAILLKNLNIDFDISLVGSGDAEYIKSLENIIYANNLQNNIHIYERVSNLEEWYRKTDIVVVCSKSEAFGRVTVEAQLSGCIVIGAACGATPELITDGETGYLYELDNIEMLRDIIIDICMNRNQASAIAKKGQTRAIKEFDKDLNCKRIINEYKKIWEMKK